MAIYQMESIIIESFRGGYDKNFVYLITDIHSGKQCLIDAALPLSGFIDAVPNTLTSILITHTHGDHIAYLNEISRHFPEAAIFSFSTRLSAPSLPQVLSDNQVIHV
ncbi:MAG: hypothetical protein GWO85_01360, partial [Simkaniaceae bacterium]|nr:hypothetical protein [Simkaniaceae bacterium]